MITEIQNSSTLNTASETTSSGGVLGKDDFLNLLVTQLKYQDPLNPLDSADFTAQLAQFSSLEALENINTNIESMISEQVDATNSQSISFIGKTVYAYGSYINLNQGVSDDLCFELESDASAVYVNIYNEAEDIIKTIDLGSLNGGSKHTAWDGKDKDGFSG